MNISIVGIGYVGLVSGICFSETGNDVCCIDVNEKKIKQLREGNLFLYEPGLVQLFKRGVKEERLRFSTNLAEAVEHADIVFLALPTPENEDGSSDLQYVLRVAEDIGKLMNKYKIIVNKSTVPIGTTDLVREQIEKNYVGEFDVVSNPEFLREGNAVSDFMKPSRVIIGTKSERVKKTMSSLYGPYVQQGNSILIMDEKSAELTKYAANSFLATKVSFMNEVAQLSEKVGANVDFIRKGMGLDDRIGKSFLYAGVGFGGSCFPKDVKSFIFQAQKLNSPFLVTKAVYQTNQHQQQFFLDKIDNYFDSLEGRRFAIWGLSFKPNTDDIREASALKGINFLLSKGASVIAFDPEAISCVKDKYGDKISYADRAEECISNADALIIYTEWREFSSPNFDFLYRHLKQPIIFDGRNIYDLDKMRTYNFDYISIGRPPVYNFSNPK